MSGAERLWFVDGIPNDADAMRRKIGLAIESMGTLWGEVRELERAGLVGSLVWRRVAGALADLRKELENAAREVRS